MNIDFTDAERKVLEEAARTGAWGITQPTAARRLGLEPEEAIEAYRSGLEKLKNP